MEVRRSAGSGHRGISTSVAAELLPRARCRLKCRFAPPMRTAPTAGRRSRLQPRLVTLPRILSCPIVGLWPVFARLCSCWCAGQRRRAQQSPEGELKSLKAAEGLDVSLFACEPLITNPAAIDVDTHGRVWVAEIQWYRAAAKDPPADKIKVLEDTDGDGRADRCVVFAEGLFCPMSICVAGPRVYVATSPDLWVYEDRDGDLARWSPHKAADRFQRAQPRPRRAQPGLGAGS